jgi:hypothetical protein
MAETKPIKTRSTSGRSPAHSIRCPDDVWEKARRRAEMEGRTISHAAALLIQGYAEGRVDLPKTVFTRKQTA